MADPFDEQLEETPNPRYAGLEKPQYATSASFRLQQAVVPVAKTIQERVTRAGSFALDNTKQARQALSRAQSFAFYQFSESKDYTPWFTRIIVLVNIVVFGVELYVMNRDYGMYFVDSSQNPTFGPNVETLLLMGAKRADLIVEEREWWRLIAPMFLHGGILHLLFNMLFLYSFGTQLEAVFGTPIVAYIYLVSGYIGVLLSCLFAPTIVGVGASGACYGLFGAAWADYVLNYSLNPAPKCDGVKLFLATALNLTLGLMPYLDNFAHVGGFISGLVTGFSSLTLDRYTPDHRRKPKKNYQLALQGIGIFMVPIMIVVMTATLYLGIDVDNSCEWCQFITCVPFPPGDSPWWTCDPCEEGASYDGNTNPFEINCPRGIGLTPIPGNFTPPSTLEELLALCRITCDF